MANQIDRGKEANPMSEIFEEMFTLLQDLETRSVAVLEYLKEQGGVGDEKLAPYLDRAAAASDVRWRAARARMDHLLAPKPKSATDVGKDEKSKGQSQPQAKGKDAEGSTPRSPGQQTESDQESNPDSKDLGKELASAQSGHKSETQKPGNSEVQPAKQSDEGRPASQRADRETPQIQKAAK